MAKKKRNGKKQKKNEISKKVRKKKTGFKKNY